MGFTSTLKFVNLGVRRRLFRRLKKPNHQWDMMKNMLDSLIKQERIETTMAKAKELQQYAEEIILHAKRDTPRSDLVVESMLRTPSARRKLYEQLVPRYSHRNFYFTRLVNQWRFRMRDAANMAYIEFVDGPNELRPARPVGYDRTVFIWRQMQASRRSFRKFEKEARHRHLLNSENKLIESCEKLKETQDHLWLTKVEEAPSTKLSTKPLKMIKGPFGSLEPFHVNIPPPKGRIKIDRYLRKRQKP